LPAWLAGQGHGQTIPLAAISRYLGPRLAGYFDPAVEAQSSNHVFPKKVRPEIAVMNQVAAAMQSITGSLAGVDPTVLKVISGGGIVAALAGITGLLSSPFFRMLALGGIGFAAGGPTRALMGGLLANSIANIGAAATGALAPLASLAGLLARAFAPVSAVLGTAGALKGSMTSTKGTRA
jgi:hypothetical protein